MNEKLNILCEKDWRIDQTLEENGCVFVPPADFKHEPYTYTYTRDAFDLSKVDFKKSLEVSQSRLTEKTNEEYIKRYQRHVERIKDDLQRDGVTKRRFPALVFIKTDDGPFVIGDGHQRYDSFTKEGVQTVTGSYFFAHPKSWWVADKINLAMNGWGEHPSETVKKALAHYLRDCAEARESGSREPTLTEYAERYSLKLDRMADAYKFDLYRKRLSKVGIDGEKLDNQSVEALIKVDKVDAAAALKIAQTAVGMRLKAGDVVPVCNDYRDPEKDADAKKMVVDLWVTRVKRNTNNGTKPITRTKNTPELGFLQSVAATLAKHKRADVVTIKQHLAGNPQYRADLKELVRLCSILIK